MSRSFRKPWYIDGYKGSQSKQFHKRQANGAVRRFKGEVQDGKWYRKLYNSWNISDYRWLWDSTPYVSRVTMEWVYPGEDRPWRVNRK